MNILRFLIPKSEIQFAYEDFSVRQTVEKMAYHRYSVFPCIDRDGKYVRSISEGDILYHIRNKNVASFVEFEDIPLSDVPTARDYLSVNANATMDDLIHMIVNQNYVPVVDDKGIFIGIVTRKAVLGYLLSRQGPSSSAD